MNLIKKLKNKKPYFFFIGAIRLSLILAIIGASLEKSWITLFVSSLSLLLTFLPNIIQKTYKIKLPIEIQIIIVLFIYGALFLGMARDWYRQIWWWDSVMHGFSGIALGFTGFLILYTLHKSNKLQASPFLIVLFSFCFALAMGALWEIFEFGMDHFFERDMQRARFSIEEIKDYGSTRLVIYDTMWDLILDSLGALIASIAGYIYLKKGKIFIFGNLIKKFEKINNF